MKKKNSNLKALPSPCFVLEEAKLLANLKILERIRKEAGVNIILAFKAFAMWPVFPLVKKYVDGATASSLNEALLCVEEMGSKAHSYAPAYLPEEFEHLIQHSSHITFNSLSQYQFFKKQVKKSAKDIVYGLRINPGFSNVKTEIYNPCATGSRLGVKAKDMPEKLPKAIRMLHFHSMCESNVYDLEKTLIILERDFVPWLKQIECINMGGGHLLTSDSYGVEKAIQILKRFKEKHELEIILEPGAAIAWRTGFLKCRVLDIVKNDEIQTAILDISFTAHIADALEMPFQPDIRGAVATEDGKYHYRMGGVSCLAGDYIPDYTFEQALRIGQELLIDDMIHYTMVKTTQFNGVKHPAIASKTIDGNYHIHREFDYLDFKNSLG